MPPPSGADDFYSILGIKPTASQNEIKRARDKLALKYHPDRCRHPHAQVRMQHINRAYDALSDPATRRAYDSILRTTSSRAHSAFRPAERQSPPFPYYRSEERVPASSARDTGPMKTRKKAWRERKRNFIFEERERGSWFDSRDRYSRTKETGPNGGFDRSDYDLPQNDFCRRPLSTSQYQQACTRSMTWAAQLGIRRLEESTPGPKTASRQKCLNAKLEQMNRKVKKAAVKAKARLRDEKPYDEQAIRERNGEIFEDAGKTSGRQDQFLPRDPELFLQAIIPEVGRRKELADAWKRERNIGRPMSNCRAKKQGRVAGNTKRQTLDADPLRLIERHSAKIAPGSEAWHQEKAEAALNQKLWRSQAMKSAAKAKLIEDKRADLLETLGAPDSMWPLPLRVLRAIVARRRANQTLPPVQQDSKAAPSLALTSAPSSALASALVPTPASDTALVVQASPHELTAMQRELDEMQLAKIRKFQDKIGNVEKPGYLEDLVSRARARLAERPQRELEKDQRFRGLMQSLDRQINAGHSEQVQAWKVRESIAHQLSYLGARSDIISRAREGRLQRARDLADTALWLEKDEIDLFSESTAFLDAKLRLWALDREDFLINKHIDLSDPSQYVFVNKDDDIVAIRHLPEPAPVEVIVPMREKRRKPKKKLVEGAELYIPFCNEALKRRVLNNHRHQNGSCTDMVLKNGEILSKPNNRSHRNVSGLSTAKEYHEAINAVCREWAGFA